MKKILRKMAVAICASCTVSVIAMENQGNMPFRLGFEFQMSGHLCPWANENDNLQKIPLFEMSYEGKKRWHVELDGSDIEFVTVPFSYKERNRLDKCMQSIKSAVDVLQNLLNDLKKWTK